MASSYDGSLIHTVYQFSELAFNGSLHIQGYSLINKVYRWRQKFDHKTFPGNTFWCANSYQAKMKNSHVSGNADDEKNLYPGSRKFIFLINLINLFK